MYSVSRINMPTNLRELLSLHTTFHFWIDMFFLCTVYIVHQLGATKYIMYVYCGRWLPTDNDMHITSMCYQLSYPYIYSVHFSHNTTHPTSYYKLYCKLLYLYPYNVIYRICKNIYSFDGVNYTEIARSNCVHFGVKRLAIYGDKALVTAGPPDGDEECWKRTETYDFETDEWTDQADYPYAE